jgi:hypothetical protein
MSHVESRPQDTDRRSGGRPGEPRLTGVTVAVVVVSALLLVGAGLLAHEYATYSGGDPLIGLAALLAIALAAPAGVGLTLTGVAWIVRRRLPRVATACASLGLAVVLLPVGLVAVSWIGPAVLG